MGRSAGFFIAFLLCFIMAKELFNILVPATSLGVPTGRGWIPTGDLIYHGAARNFLLHANQARHFRRPAHRTLSAEFGHADLQVHGAGALPQRAPGLHPVPDRPRRSCFPIGGALVYFFFMPMVMWFFLSDGQQGWSRRARSRSRLLPMGLGKISAWSDADPSACRAGVPAARW